MDDCAHELEGAIGTYISWRADQLSSPPFSQKLRQEIEEGLQEKANGGATFQCVLLTVAKLRAVTIYELPGVLKETAPDLESLFRQASDRIHDLDGKTSHLCPPRLEPGRARRLGGPPGQ